MKIFSFVVSVVLFALLFISCDTTTGSSNGEDSPKTITGTVTVPDSLKSFAVIVSGTPDSLSVFADKDIITSIWNGDNPYSMLVKISTAAGGNARDFSLDLADNPEEFGIVLAFVDRNGNGKLDFPGEEARLPVKKIDGVDEVIWSWGYITIGDNSQYLVAYGNGNNSGLDVVGTDGFNFGF